MKKLVKINKVKGFSLVEILVVMAIIATLLTLGLPRIQEALKNTAKLQTLDRAKDLSRALSNFSSDRGGYPDDDTALDILDFMELSDGDKKIGTLTGSANAYFRQLFPGGYANEEDMFAAPRFNDADNIVSPAGDELLREEENAYGYMMLDGGFALSSRRGGQKVLAITPLLEGKEEEGLIDPSVYNNNAIVIFADGSVKELKAILLPGDEEAKLELPGNKKIFDDEIWGEDKPLLFAPEF